MRIWPVFVVVFASCGGAAGSPPTTVDQELIDELALVLQIDEAWERLSPAERGEVCSSPASRLRALMSGIIDDDDLDEAAQLLLDHC